MPDSPWEGPKSCYEKKTHRSHLTQTGNRDHILGRGSFTIPFSHSIKYDPFDTSDKTSHQVHAQWWFAIGAICRSWQSRDGIYIDRSGANSCNLIRWIAFRLKYPITYLIFNQFIAPPEQNAWSCIFRVSFFVNSWSKWPSVVMINMTQPSPSCGIQRNVDLKKEQDEKNELHYFQLCFLTKLSICIA